MENEGYKEVYFDQYCKDCEHSSLKDTDEPCNECLDHPINLYSHKPVNWVKAEKKKDK